MNKIKIALKFWLTLISLLCFHFSFSQENYIPGYVIKNNADTLYGYVDYRNWAKNPNMVKFKTNVSSTATSFKSTDIREFKVADEIYVSGIVETEISPIKTSKIESNPQVNIKIDSIFLQTLFRGEKSLFYYRNSDGKDNFYIKQDSKFNLLVYKRYLKEGNVIAENSKYLGQLTLYLNDCQSINSKFEKTVYNIKSLMKLFEYYYTCSPSGVSFQKEREKIQTEIGALTGVSLTTLELNSIAFHSLVNVDYNSSINPTLGLFFDLILPRNRGKWSINNELLFTTYKVKGQFNDFHAVATNELGYSYLNINNLIRFKYPIRQWSLFVNAGISNGFSISETNSKKIEASRVYEELALNETRKHEQSLILGTGIKYDRLSLEIRYEKGNGMSEYTALSSVTRNYFFLLGYIF